MTTIHSDDIFISMRLVLLIPTMYHTGVCNSVKANSQKSFVGHPTISCVSKCIEKIAFKYIFNHLIFNRLLYKFQSGFIPVYSTTHQLVELYHNILLALDNKEMTSITFADVSKAFDRVWIRGLISKLERYGVKGELLCWLKSYLSNRCQRVIIKKKMQFLVLESSRLVCPRDQYWDPCYFLYL